MAISSVSTVNENSQVTPTSPGAAPITSLLNNTKTGDTTATKETTSTPKTDAGSTPGATSDFKAFMLKALGGTAQPQLSEEELYSQIIGKMLTDKDQAAGDFYQQKLAELKVSMARPGDGYVSYEAVGAAALKATVDAGKIDDAAAQEINGAAFAAAQLDEHTDVLWDSRGSGDDPTVATSTFDEAMSKVDAMLAKISSGELSPTSRSLDASGAGAGATGISSGSSLSGAQQLDGSGGFLWKPESERDGNLVVLMPSELKGLVDKVEVYKSLPPTADGLLGSGKVSSYTDDNRGNWRFDKPGSEFGDNVYVVTTRTDGTQITWAIDDGGARRD